MAPPIQAPGRARFLLLELLDPHELRLAVAVMLAVGLVVGGGGIWRVGMPLWGATTVVLGFLLVPGVLKWRADRRRFGLVAMMLSILLAMQGFHTVEHIVQWFQYHILNWTPREATGLLSAANSE